MQEMTIQELYLIFRDCEEIAEEISGALAPILFENSTYYQIFGKYFEDIKNDVVTEASSLRIAEYIKLNPLSTVPQMINILNSRYKDYVDYGIENTNETALKIKKYITRLMRLIQ